MKISLKVHNNETVACIKLCYEQLWLGAMSLAHS